MARSLLAAGFCVGHYAQDKYREQIGVLEDNAYRFCADGALQRACGFEFHVSPRGTKQEALYLTLGAQLDKLADERTVAHVDTLISYSDTYGCKKTLEIFDAAIEQTAAELGPAEGHRLS